HVIASYARTANQAAIAGASSANAGFWKKRSPARSNGRRKNNYEKEKMMSLMNAADEVRFPVGDFVIDPVSTDEKRRRWIGEMAQTPANLRAALAGLSDDQLDTRYREGGWSLRQVAHHLADAHLNGFARFKLALTEENPPIKTYEEALWAETVDGREAPVELSLKLLEALHDNSTGASRPST